MKIDKSRFLLLTTSLAATAAAAVAVATSACNTVNTDTDGGSNTNVDSGNVVDSGSSNNDDAAADAAPACLANAAPAPLCEPVAEGVDAGDAGTVAKCGFECTNASRTFKTAIAKSISDCLDLAVPSPDAEGCAAAAPACTAQATAKACDDSEAAAFCTTFLTSCGIDGADAGADGGITPQARCISIARALSTEGKADLSSCAAESLSCDDCFNQFLGTQP